MNEKDKKEEMLDKTIDAYQESTGNLPDENQQMVIFTLVNEYVADEGKPVE